MKSVVMTSIITRTVAMKSILSITCALMLLGSTMVSTPVYADGLNTLLKKVEQGRLQERRAHRAREQKFLANKQQQQQLYNGIQQQVATAKSESTTLETRFQNNKNNLDELKTQLSTRMGSLKELFSHLNSATSKFSSHLESAISSAEYPDRQSTLKAITASVSNQDSLPSISDMETLWLEMQKELIASGEISQFKAKVIDERGEAHDKDIVRLGTFNLLSDGQYLQYIPETERLLAFPKQPPDHFLKAALNFQEQNSGMAAVGIDPTRGVVIEAMVAVPTIMDRIEQGGIIGYIILALGALALLISIERLIRLQIIDHRVTRQARSKKIDTNNPLGRIFKVYQDNPDLDVEALELKLGEAILKERLPLERFLSSIKIVAVVAPLMGLLGTVTGMINTFQAITLSGAGDPRIMAGGISQALVTTIEGLSVAVPIILMHSIVSSRYRHILLVIEEQSTGLIAAMAERESSHAVSN